MKEKIYKLLPHFLQNFLIYLYNKKAYRLRYGGRYWEYRKEKKNNRSLSLKELKEYQRRRYSKFIDFIFKNSTFYHERLLSIKGVNKLKNIQSIPLMDKETLRAHINEIIVNTSEKLYASKTGGTTGKSLEVKNFPCNQQERFAFLDDFRSRQGYELGKKTAWFSGKSLLTDRDIRKKRFWKTDKFHHVRYYSTFHIKKEYLQYYVEDLIQFAPEYFVGFPSTMLEIAKYGLTHNYDFPEGVTRAIFPTAETVTQNMRSKIESFFKTKIYNQYASSEGAPFIFECKKGNLHLELQSGVFEVLDENDNRAQSGRLVVTSFTSEGTPLLRYDIGDSIMLEDPSKTCTCGNNNPLVKEILGRVDDYLYSPETGKINLGNISNTLKDTKGIIRFQATQNQLDTICIKVIIDKEAYSKKVENKFKENWRDRIGKKMKLNIEYVEDIPVEPSGKTRMVKNNIKHLIN